MHLSPLLTDKYQVTMAYTYWKAATHETASCFDLYFRKAPFHLPFAVFAGLHQCIRFIHSFRFTPRHTNYISTLIPNCDPRFLAWLQAVHCKSLRVMAQKEGSFVFANVPLMRLSGPLAIVQLLETTLLNLVNYATLVATNAFRFRLAAGPHASLFEFGLRRAQGPDGAMSASRYTFQAGFDATSNLAAGLEFDIPVVGTHAHSFVQSFSSSHDASPDHLFLTSSSGNQISFDAFRHRVLHIRDSVASSYKTVHAELVAFMCYAVVHPHSFVALVDTYNSLQSGVPNFMCVALTLHEHAFTPLGIRLDSGDLGRLSIGAHSLFHDIAKAYIQRYGADADQVNSMVSALSIVASDNITVPKLHQLRNLDHKISAYGIGTHLVTCFEQPALGAVFKLSSIAHEPRIKFSDDHTKTSTPGEKVAYRAYDHGGKAMCDILALEHERVETAENKLTLRDRDQPHLIVTVFPHRIRKLLHLVWDGEACSEQLDARQCTQRAKRRLAVDAAEFDPDVIGQICEGKKYPVLISPSLYQLLCIK
ncbi:unnamed protein product [Agarophyton chilense]